ncbi:hypothetical protein TNCV_4098921 [Trichonephila clavipes]|nr:hypothetical protein TNCV_4098921 [Trichonephila clavipes]
MTGNTLPGLTNLVSNGIKLMDVYGNGKSHESMDPLCQLGTIQAGGGSVTKRSPPPLTPTDLWTALQDSWCQLPPALLQTLIKYPCHVVLQDLSRCTNFLALQCTF